MSKEKYENLYIKTFGNFDIKYSGKTIFIKKRNQAKLEAILQYLVLNNGKAINPVKIIEDIWPENDYTDYKKVLQTYVYRIKNFLSGENYFGKDFSPNLSITNVKGDYRLDFLKGVILDENIFEDITKEIKEEDDCNKLILIADKLRDIYEGEYMAGFYNEYLVLRKRNFYRQLYSASITILLNKLYDGKIFDSEIIRLCEAFFTIDDIDEDVNLIFLKTLIRSNNRSHAKRHFDYISVKMNEVLGITPGRSITDLFKKEEKEETDYAFQKTGSLVLSREDLDRIIEERIAERLRPENPIYTMLKVEITGNIDYIPEESIASLFQGSLRKNDVYAVIDGLNFILMLYRVNYDAVPIVKLRIIERISKLFKEEEVKLNINVYPTTTIG
ncbi:hypothetical protein [Anaeropeptidivorans aminofermentans]|uniref:hypothetical protein n=1 Tax=Anaeropeptidivorans aminofermentans TaxID=2934315 RepID=UPI0020254E85|nr:hypothetical protein [Anaeropeptidivorans aminofermentans]